MNATERGRLLIVEPDLSILHSYRLRLAEAGFSVEEASEGKDALRRIENKQFDFLICDVKMRDMSGLELLRQVRQRSASVQSVLLLDNPDNKLVVRATELGAVQCLFKPIKAELLVEAALAFARRPLVQASGSFGDIRIAKGPANKPASFSATEAKNKFGVILEKVIQGDSVVITKHDTAKAVLMSISEFNALSKASESKINTLTAEFDSLLARMQGPAARKAMDAAFHASPKQLGMAAVAAARKRD